METNQQNDDINLLNWILATVGVFVCLGAGVCGMLVVGSGLPSRLLFSGVASVNPDFNGNYPVPNPTAVSDTLENGFLDPATGFSHIALSDDGAYLAAWGDEGIVMFDAARQIKLWSKPSDFPVVGAFRPDGAVFALAFQTDFATTYANIIDPYTGDIIDSSLYAGSSEAQMLAWSQDGTRFVVSLQGTLSVYTDESYGYSYSLDLYSDDSETLIEVGLGAGGDAAFILNHDENSPGGAGYEYEVWGVPTYQRVYILSLGQGDEGISVGWSPDQQEFASKVGGNPLQLWEQDTLTGEFVERLVSTVTLESFALDWSPDGTLLLVSGLDDNEFVVVDVATRTIVFSENLRGTGSSSPDAPYQAAWSPNGKHLGFILANGEIEVWDVEKESHIVTIGTWAQSTLTEMDIVWVDDEMLAVVARELEGVIFATPFED